MITHSKKTKQKNTVKTFLYFEFCTKKNIHKINRLINILVKK